MISDTITGIKNQPFNPVSVVKKPSDILTTKIYGEEKRRKNTENIEQRNSYKKAKVYRKEEKIYHSHGITHDTIAVKSIISWEGEKRWLLATRWEITQLKNYEKRIGCSQKKN